MFEFVTRTRRILAGVTVVACLASAAPAFDAPRRPFVFHWAGGNGPGTAGEAWRDWAGAVNFGNIPIRRDVVMLYQSDTGLYPYAGIHQVEADPDWMRRHFAKLQLWINHEIPDVNFSGYAIIDYEQWEWCWAMLVNNPSNQGPDARDTDFKDDWRDFMRTGHTAELQAMSADQQEAYFASTYNDAVRRFMTATITECKRLRPNAKWGFYNCPPKSYLEFVPMGPRADAYVAMLRRDLQWVIDVSDALFPDVYALNYTIPDGPSHRAHQDFESEHRLYVQSNVLTAVRFANGAKPVIAFYWLRYHDSTGSYAYTFVSPLNLRIALEESQRAGADGIALWEAFNSNRNLSDYQSYLNATAAPIIRQFATDEAGNLAGAGTSGGSNGSSSGGSSPSGGTSSSGNPLSSPYVNVTGNGESGDGSAAERTASGMRDRAERRAADQRMARIIANAVANNGRNIARGANRFLNPPRVAGSSTPGGGQP